MTITPKFRLLPLCFLLVAASGSAFAQVQEGLRGEIAQLANESEIRAYSYESPSGTKPIVSMDDKKILPEFQKIVENDTVSFMYRRDAFHAYIRVGDTVFDMWGRGDGEKLPEVHVRSYQKLMEGSNSKLWFEAVFQIEKADRALLQQFYFYRSAMILEHREAFASGKSFLNAWSREFVDKGTPPFVGKENCTGFALSAFNESFFENNPSVEELSKVHTKAKTLARSVGSTLEFVEPAVLLAAMKRMPGKYRIPLVSAPPGLMRMVNLHERGVGYVIHNFKKNEDFVRKNSMNFGAKYGVKTPLDVGFDVSIRGRTHIAQSPLLTALPACTRNVRRLIR